MNTFYRTVRGLLLLLLVFAPLQTLLADDDYIEARRLLDSGEILPLADILKSVRKHHPGRVLEVELEDEDGQVVYEVEILGPDGVVREILVNARNGEILHVEEDD